MIIKFERFKEFKNPSMKELLDFARENNWQNYRIDWDAWLNNDVVIMERLPWNQDQKRSTVG